MKILTALLTALGAGPMTETLLILLCFACVGLAGLSVWAVYSIARSKDHSK